MQIITIINNSNKYILGIFVMSFLACNETKIPLNLSDVSISFYEMKDVDPNLKDIINKDIALCYKIPRYRSEEDTMILTHFHDEGWCLKFGKKGVAFAYNGTLTEYKNVGKDTILLLGSSSGEIFCSWYYIDCDYELKIGNFSEYHTTKDPRMRSEYFPCPISLAPQASYFYFDPDSRPPLFDPKQPKKICNISKKSMRQFLYYKRATDSLYSFWLRFPDIIDNPLDLLQQNKSMIAPNRHIELYHTIYDDPNARHYQDSLVKSWINK